MAKYPEHEKLRAAQATALILSGFIDFIGERGWYLTEYAEESERLFMIRERPDEIIGLYLGIDPKKLSAEKDAMYQEIVAAKDTDQHSQV